MISLIFSYIKPRLSFYGLGKAENLSTRLRLFMNGGLGSIRLRSGPPCFSGIRRFCSLGGARQSPNIFH